MYKNKKIIAIIPARCGSKGIINKNIRDFCGKPLIYYSIKSALNSKYVDYCFVSTDSKEYAEIAESFGANVPFLRPDFYATDSSKTIECIYYSIQEFKKRNMFFDTLVLLQPTSPLRNSNDIDNAIELFFENNQTDLASVEEIDTNPYLLRKIDDKVLIPILQKPSSIRRQDVGKMYIVNGSIYINDVSMLSPKTSFNDNRLAFVMDGTKSVDIDDINDFKKAEELFRKNNENSN